jgi:hypothetical protein
VEETKVISIPLPQKQIGIIIGIMHDTIMEWRKDKEGIPDLYVEVN